MPAIDDPFGVAASLPGQVAKLRMDIKDLAANNTQAASLAASSATAAAASANAAAASATSAAAAATAATVSGTVAHNGSTSFALTSTPTEIVRATVTVPTGYTQALVFATSAMTVGNHSTTSGDVIHGYVDINGAAGPASGGTFVNINVPSSLSVSYSYLYQGLTGGSSFYVRAVFYNEANATGITGPANTCNIDAIITYLR